MESEIIGHYVSIDRTRIYFEQCGEGVPLVCLHSAGNCSSLFFDFLPIMAKNGFRVIAVDLPGHGKSLPVNWQPFRVAREYAEFTWKIIQAVVQGQKPVVVGVATGGDIVLDLACHHSEDMRAAVCCEGAASTPTFPNCYEYEDPHACPGWRDIIERAVIAALFRPCPETKITELRWLQRNCAQEIGAGDLQCWSNHNVKDKLKYIKCPVLVFKGEADDYISKEMLNETMSGIPVGLGELIVGKKMGHMPAFENPQDFTKIILDFLRRKRII